MRLLLFFLVAVLFSPFIYGQQRGVVTTKVYLDSTPPKTHYDSVLFSIPNVLTISFMEGFDDSVFIFRQGRCIDSMFLVTNESIGFAGSMGIRYVNKDEAVDLAIRFKSSGLIIQERLRLNFRHLQVRHLGQWELYYSNHFPRLE